METNWIKIDALHKLPKCTEVLAYNKKWIDEDFCPNGIRIGFLGEDGFFSAKWVNDQDCYATCCEEGDDYDTFCGDKTYYHRNGEAIEGHLPNMPTHYMLIPNCND